MTAKIVLFPSPCCDLPDAIDSSEAFSVTWDAFGRPVKIDPEFERLTGVPAADCYNGNWIERVHPDDVHAYVRKRHQALGAGRPFKGTLRFMTDAGIYVQLTVQTVPVLDERGRITRWSGCVTFRSSDLVQLLKAAQAACLFAWGIGQLVTSSL